MEAGAAPSLCSPPQLLFSQGTAPPPPPHPSAPPLNSSYPAASIPSVEQPVSGEICGEPLEPVHVREEEKGSSPVRQKEKDSSQIRQKKRRKKLDDEKLKQVVKGNSCDTIVQDLLPKKANLMWFRDCSRFIWLDIEWSTVDDVYNA
ncbi:hypothetical protein ACQ4PT_005443 [Festuca glaucescens]